MFNNRELLTRWIHNRFDEYLPYDWQFTYLTYCDQIPRFPSLISIRLCCYPVSELRLAKTTAKGVFCVYMLSMASSRAWPNR